MRPNRLLTLLTVAVIAAGCTSTTGDAFTITVRSTADTCEVEPVRAPTGTVAFDVTNDGSDVTEFYLYAEDGERVIGEVEDIGPGLTRTLTVQVEPGTYVTACKPGMVGDGIRAGFTVDNAE